MTFISKPKIFCIGFNKTGTTSLTHTLIAHGFIMGDQYEGELLLDSYIDRDFIKIKNFCESAEAFQDVPFSLPFLYVYLDQVFKNSKFILTIRDSAEQWYKSLLGFHSNFLNSENEIPDVSELENADYIYKGWLNRYMSIYNTINDNPYNREDLLTTYRRHNNNVRDYFKNRKNLLVINLGEDESYLDFTKFLGLKPLFEKFPWHNKTIK